MKKINKFGVITHQSTYIGCNNITTFFLTPSLMYLENIDGWSDILKSSIRDQMNMNVRGLFEMNKYIRMLNPCPLFYFEIHCTAQ